MDIKILIISLVITIAINFYYRKEIKEISNKVAEKIINKIKEMR